MAAPANVTLTSDFSGAITPEQAQPYFDQMAKISVVQRLARRVPLGASGERIPFWNGTVQASWVAEGGMKPIVEGAVSSQTMSPHKIAAIFTVSSEVVRANPDDYLSLMRTKVAEAFALAFDAAVLHGTNTPFGAYLGQTTNSVSIVDPGGAGQATNNDVYSALNGGLSLLAAGGKKWNGTLFDDKAESIINSNVDGNKRPIFLDMTPPVDQAVPMREGRILGRPTFISDHVYSGSTIGFMGDFNQVIWGQIGGISYDVTDQATLNFGTEASPNMISLWQYNLVAVRVEAEFGALVHDTASFVKLTNTETA